MNGDRPWAGLQIRDLPGVITRLVERAGNRFPQDASVRFEVRYLRRKPGRGLVVMYVSHDALSEWRATSARSRSYASQLVSLTLDEPALDGNRIRFGADEVSRSPLEVEAPGLLRAKDLHLTIAKFPADEGLPALVASCNTAEGSPVFSALESAARVQLDNASWQLVSARVEPVRYKPESRCVLRYELFLRRGSNRDQVPLERHVTVFAKLFASPEQADSVYANLDRLYRDRRGDSQRFPLVPQPLGILRGLGLILSEAIVPGDQPAGGTMPTLGTRELGLAATALARLHTGAPPAQLGEPGTGSTEAARTRDRGAMLAALYPQQAASLLRLVDQVAIRLSNEQSDGCRPVHGGFKPSQLLFSAGRVFVVDFDRLGQGDPALDLGCFRAYLRPNQFWSRPSPVRSWFEEAAAVFSRKYHQALLDQEMPGDAAEGILRRAPLYEAARLIKIAARRVHRLNSARPHELSRMCDEISTCLSHTVRAAS